MWQTRDIHERVSALERLLTELAAHQDSPAGVAGMAAVRSVIDIYGEALARIMAVLDQAGSDVMDALISDDLIAQLLLVHDLHPVDAATRIRTALAGLRPHADAELMGIDSGVARVRLTAGGCGSTVAALRATVDDAVRAVAPEVADVQVEVAAPTTAAFVPLSTVRVRS